MRRKTQRSLLQLVIFLSVLAFVIILNRPQPNPVLAWNRIRYKTTSPNLPEARGVCPGLESTSKPALVVSRVTSDGDASWLDSLAKSYHLCVYTADAPLNEKSTQLQVPANRGHEAMAYLTFLIDNYAHIPAAGAVFVHGTRWAWHNDGPDYDNRALLAALNLSSALAPSGYHNLRCDWSISSCVPSSPPQGSLETSLQAVLDPFDAHTVSDAALPRALAVLFGGDGYVSGGQAGGGGGGEGRVLLGRTVAVRTQCCAQFVVARENVWQHSRDEYVALRQWLLDGSSASANGNAASPDDRVAGKVLSYVWHILFIKQSESKSQGSSPAANGGVDLERLNTLACPRADECYCRLYGRCNLEHCSSPGTCHGQYRLPKNMRLPDDWALTHS